MFRGIIGAVQKAAGDLQAARGEGSVTGGGPAPMDLPMDELQERLRRAEA